MFRKKSANNEITAIPNLKIEIKNIEKASSIKLLGVKLDEHISWNDHIKTVEDKVAKNIGLLNRSFYFSMNIL